MEIRSLDSIDFSLITKCFNESFADYVIPFSVNDDYLKRRFKRGRVDYRYSFGAFVNGRLVGLIMHGIDYVNGLKVAFDLGTGVIPEFRGQRLVNVIFDHAIPFLKKEGIEQCRLEVICGNEKAIRAYEKAGFSVIRNLQCFNGEINTNANKDNSFEFIKASTINWQKYSELALYDYSWENSMNGLKILNDDFDVWELYENKLMVGYVFIDPTIGYIPQFGVNKKNIHKYVLQLFRGVEGIIKKVKINNIDFTETYLIDLLLSIGINKNISQHEMGLLIK